MTNNLRWRFGVMMFLQFMVWAAWFINLGPYLGHLGYSSKLVSAFFLASLISPFIGGQIADRYLPTQIYMAISHLIGGVLLILLAKVQSYYLMWTVLFLFSMIYAPTLGLTNSICFHHLKDKTKEFGAIRVWGSLGWIVAGLAMGLFWKYVHPYPMQWDEIAKLAEPEQAAQRAAYLSVESWLFIFPGIVSIIYGFFCFLLPHTPPSKESSNPFAFLEAFKMLQDKNFAMFMVISFVVSTQLNFFFMTIPVLMGALGMTRANIPMAQVTAQITEILALYFFLKWWLPKLGIRMSMAFAALAWGLLYAAAAFGNAWWLVVCTQPFHGFAYVFFFVVGQMYVDAAAPAQIRASAQSFITVVTIGLGMFLSSFWVSWINELFTSSEGVVNYTGVFVVPFVLMMACMFAFLFFFKEPKTQEQAS